MKIQSKIQYLESQVSPLYIPSHENWILLDRAHENREQIIILEEGAKLDFYSARTSGNLDLHIIHRGSKSTSQVRCGFHASENGKIAATIKSTFEVSEATSEIHILSLADSHAEVLLDSTIDIQEGVRHIIGRLKERHIFLGSGGKIRGIPALIVHSDDIEATHALAIDRISDTELFYLLSRGFSSVDATSLLLNGAISEVFSGLENTDAGVFEECKNKVLKIGDLFDEKERSFQFSK